MWFLNLFEANKRHLFAEFRATMYIYRKKQCWKHFIFVCSRHRDVCPFFTFALLFQLKFSHHHFSAMAPINFSATPPQFMERKNVLLSRIFQKFSPITLIPFSCLLSPVSRHMSPVSRLTSLISVLTSPVSRSCLTSPVSRLLSHVSLVWVVSCLLSHVSILNGLQHLSVWRKKKNQRAKKWGCSRPRWGWPTGPEGTAGWTCTYSGLRVPAVYERRSSPSWLENGPCDTNF